MGLSDPDIPAASKLAGKLNYLLAIVLSFIN
jgi:hypothetical protein